MPAASRNTFSGLVLIAAAFIAPPAASATGRIETSLTKPTITDPAHPAVVNVRIRNTGDAPVSIMEWDTPLAKAGGRLPRSMFEVNDKDGNEVQYRGTWVYLGRLTMESFRLIYPGEVLSKDVDLEKEYRFLPNETYEVTYVLNLSREPDWDITSAAEAASFVRPTQKSVSSNAVSITLGSLATP